MTIRRRMARIERCGTVERGVGLQLPVPPKWTEDASCAQVDPEVWFPEKGGSTAGAKRICRACPVVFECLEYALTHHIRWGVWGGLSDRERYALLRQRRAAALVDVLANLEEAS